MKIYAAADIHAKKARIAVIRETVDRVAPEVFVAAGDITHYTANPRMIGELSRLPVPVIAVSGNTDRKGALRLMVDAPNLNWLHLATATIGGIDFAGISGTVPLPFRSKVALRENALMAEAADLIGPETVLVAHPPPLGTRDRVLGRFHAGSRLLRDLLLKCRPRLLICGHIHEQAGVAALGETLVVNCSMGRSGAGALIHLDPGHPPRVRMLG